MTVYGIDTSHYNTWPDISKQDFVFQKCTQGNWYVDPTYATRRDLVHSASKVFGAYHFLETSSSIQSQIAWFLSHANLRPGDVAILDFESDGTWSRYQPGQLATFATEFMNGLTIANPQLLYCNVTTRDTIVIPGKVPIKDGLWLAHPGSDPGGELFWQSGISNGIDSDQSAAFSNFAQLLQWAGPAPVPAPVPETEIDDMGLSSHNNFETIVVPNGATKFRMVFAGDPGAGHIWFVNGSTTPVSYPHDESYSLSMDQTKDWSIPAGTTHVTVQVDGVVAPWSASFLTT